MVTELVKSENSYQAAFQTVRELSPTVAWLELVRSSAMDRFEQLGFPPVTDEEWKYTNLTSLAKESFSPTISGGEIAVRDVTRFAYPETAAFIRRLMMERGLPVPPENRNILSICVVTLCQ